LAEAGAASQVVKKSQGIFVGAAHLQLAHSLVTPGILPVLALNLAVNDIGSRQRAASSKQQR
jgi:hypothetical protein